MKISRAIIGKNEVIKKLKELPSTKHVVEMLSVDVPLVTSALVNFIVRGTFTEGDDTSKGKH